MILGKIAGTIVATKKDEGLVGMKLLIVQQYTVELKPTANYLVAVDAVGAGANEFVLVVSGSSARATKRTEGKPVDAAIVGIIDSLHMKGQAEEQKLL
ncbi:MAG TPA: EutN/CcmL family microcompartment protein [Candidatus Wallbacteria bacterium]|mgnify:CR=1 FL=1|nr:EutN/CcmL family microcompartment protein [Candidatus Wallbacteria bacterium]